MLLVFLLVVVLVLAASCVVLVLVLPYVLAVAVATAVLAVATVAETCFLCFASLRRDLGILVSPVESLRLPHPKDPV